MSYKDLKSFQQAAVIYDFTVEFCDRYVDKSDRSYRSDRMVGQMVQAARSGKQNIAEGCAVSKTSPKNELFLLGVARGSLKELLEDYEDFLRQRGLAQWQKEDARAQEVRRLAYGNKLGRSDPGSTATGAADYGAGRSDKTDKSNMSDRGDRPDTTGRSYTTYSTYLDDPERAANAMITLINQTTYLLDQQIKAVGQQMEEKGIARESHDQKLRRVMNEDKKKNEEFDAYLRKIVEDGKNKSGKSDTIDKNDKTDRLGVAGFIKGKVLIAVGAVAVLVVLGGIYALNKTDTSDRAYRPDTPTFSSSISPIISLGISVAEAQALPQGIALIESHIAIFGPRNERMNERVDLELKAQDNGEYGLVVNKKDTHAFTPGKYTVSADIETKQGIRHITQDFLWGVLAINPNKSIYQPGETANLALAVLDERGMMVCDASLRLELKAQSSKLKTKEDILSTENGRIRVNPECYQKKVTQRPDYETEYTVQGPGIYQMTLTATTKNGTYTIEDFFEVREVALRQAQGDKFFDIERITATRIYPVHEYPVTIRVTPEEDFKGTVTETVPESFGVSCHSELVEESSEASGARGCSLDPSASPQDDKRGKMISWQVDWRAHQTYELSYTYKSPEISPQFYLLGPLVLRQAQDDKMVFEEVRQWQVAVDAIAYDTTSNSGNQTSVSSFSWSHTVTSSGSDRILIVGVSMADTTDPNRTVTGVTYNTVAMTNIREDDNDTSNISSALWYLVNPTTGANTVVVTLNGTNSFVVGGALSFTGVAQSGSIEANNGSTPTNADSVSTNVTTVTDNAWVVDVGIESIPFGSDVPTVGAGQTERWNVNMTLGADGFGSTEGPKTPAGAVTMSWSTGNASSDWAHSAAAIKPASAPSVSSVTDTPDPTNPGRSVTFITDWNDADSGETVKVKACKTDSLTGQNCDGGFWASSSAFTTSDPESLVYDIVGGDAGQTRSYYVFVCDDDADCSSSTSGTFTVNLFSTIPNTKIRGAQGQGAGKVNWR